MTGANLSGSKYPRKNSMDYIPGIVHRAVVDGKESSVYLTLESIGLDKKPRFRWAPGQENAHQLIPADSKVEVGERMIRFSSMPITGLKNP